MCKQQLKFNLLLDEFSEILTFSETRRGGARDFKYYVRQIMVLLFGLR
jgi:hypothetical protein